MEQPGDAELLRLPDGRDAQFWRCGEVAAPVVFFMHGCPDCRLAARTGEAAARRAGVQLIAVNRPGYGLSSASRSSHVSVADDIVAVADLLGIERFAVLGMSLGGPYALACAVRHPARVTAVGVVASPGLPPELDPPGHRDDLSETQQEFYQRLGTCSVEEAIDLIRPEFEEYVGRLAPADTDDDALALRWTEGLHPLDAQLMADLPAADVAEAAREALACHDGYLRDAAVTFRSWGFRPEEVRRPSWFWYGDLDVNAPVRNGRWFAERVPAANLVIRPKTAHLGTLVEYWDEMLTTLRDAG
jgi:pimeloyl-ACP methyl ester carboxylesterase